MNAYIPKVAKIIDLIKHTEKEWTFRVECDTKNILPGKFFEISMPKYGESPISVSGYGENYVDFTIRNVGKVTSEIFKYEVGDSLLIRGPYGNGFNLENYIGRELTVVAGGSALAPVRGIVEYVYQNPNKFNNFNLIVGFRTINDALFKDDLKRWTEKLNVIVTVDKETEGYDGFVGLVDRKSVV